VCPIQFESLLVCPIQFESRLIFVGLPSTVFWSAVKRNGDKALHIVDFGLGSVSEFTFRMKRPGCGSWCLWMLSLRTSFPSVSYSLQWSPLFLFVTHQILRFRVPVSCVLFVGTGHSLRSEFQVCFCFVALPSLSQNVETKVDSGCHYERRIITFKT
jgi:hypothetical protein